MRDKLDRFSIGCLLDTNFGPFHQPAPARDQVKSGVSQLIDEGVLAEEVGFEGVFVPESHMRTETIFSNPLLLLSALAVRTSRIRLATYALVPAYGWNPMHLAESTAMVDHLSGGRLTLVLALGLVPESFAMFHVDPKQRVSRFNESVEVLRKAWTSHEPFSFAGKRFRFENVWLTQKPLQQDPHPTLWAGGLRDEAIRRAASFATGWCTTPFPLRRDVWDRQVALFRSEARANGVENPKIVLMRDGFCAETRDAAERVARECFIPEWLCYFDAGVLSEQDPGIQTRSDVTVEKLRQHLVIGTPDDCIEALERHKSAYAADYVVLRLRCGWGPDNEATQACMRLVGERVLPHFHQHAAAGN